MIASARKHTSHKYFIFWFTLCTAYKILLNAFIHVNCFIDSCLNFDNLQVIINDLAEKVREFLREYNSPPSGSFFDQMTDKQKNVDLELAEQQLLLEEQDKQTNKEQVSECILVQIAYLYTCNIYRCI